MNIRSINARLYDSNTVGLKMDFGTHQYTGDDIDPRLDQGSRKKNQSYY